MKILKYMAFFFLWKIPPSTLPPSPITPPLWSTPPPKKINFLSPPYLLFKTSVLRKLSSPFPYLPPLSAKYEFQNAYFMCVLFTHGHMFGVNTLNQNIARNTNASLNNFEMKTTSFHIFTEISLNRHHYIHVFSNIV